MVGGSGVVAHAQQTPPEPPGAWASVGCMIGLALLGPSTTWLPVVAFQWYSVPPAFLRASRLRNPTTPQLCSIIQIFRHGCDHQRSLSTSMMADAAGLSASLKSCDHEPDCLPMRSSRWSTAARAANFVPTEKDDLPSLSRWTDCPVVCSSSSSHSLADSLAISK